MISAVQSVCGGSPGFKPDQFIDFHPARGSLESPIFHEAFEQNRLPARLLNIFCWREYADECIIPSGASAQSRSALGLAARSEQGGHPGSLFFDISDLCKSLSGKAVQQKGVRQIKRRVQRKGTGGAAPQAAALPVAISL